jgi:hypothetical protein
VIGAAAAESARRRRESGGGSRINTAVGRCGRGVLARCDDDGGVDDGGSGAVWEASGAAAVESTRRSADAGEAS